MSNMNTTDIETTNTINVVENTEVEQNMTNDDKYEAEFAAALAEEVQMDAQIELQAGTEDAQVIAEPVVQADVSTKESKKEPAGPPAYEAFMAAVSAHAKALGLDVKEQKHFFQIFAGTGHKLYVAKDKKSVNRVDTTLPRTALVVNGRDISLPLDTPNGRIACHIDPTVESVLTALDVMANFKDKIPAPRKGAPKGYYPKAETTTQS